MAKTIDGKKTFYCNSFIGKKGQKAIFLVVSGLDVHFGFALSANTIVCPKNWVPISNFVQP